MSDLTPGVYEQLVTHALDRRLRAVPGELVEVTSIDQADAEDYLIRHIAALTRHALRAAKTPEQQIGRANHIAEAIIREFLDTEDEGERIVQPGQLLTEVRRPSGIPGRPEPRTRPEIPLSASALLVNGRGQPSIGTEVKREFATADRVDLICAFIKWYGLRLIEGSIKEFIARGGELRVITTTYIGATDRAALDRLVALGATVKISYETHSTRLHAKAWMFHRHTGFSTAYVGSSNLSKAAQLDGLEWNVRLTQIEQAHLLSTFTATFEQYWADPAFEDYDPARDGSRLAEALKREGGSTPTDLPLEIATLDVLPRWYQAEALEELEAEREVHGRMHNLVVMATGTGKTVIAALDYRRLAAAGKVDSVLFVAHQEKILDQSRATFRQTLRDGEFGEKLVAGHRPKKWRHVFASVQSLANINLDELNPARFDMVIVDEFHHAQAPTYRRLLEHLQPRYLLGLTATPERTDGVDVGVFFGGRIAYELRLWQALEQQLLAPFHYFGIHDEVSLADVTWRRGHYDEVALSELYTGNHARVRLILQAVQDKIAHPGEMRALGFCVSVQHARFMADQFTKHGIPSLAVTGDTPLDERRLAVHRLRKGEVNALFTVDLFNEGVDIPEVDTVLFLRPTESATVFLQQLGRGLRRDPNKTCLTALDFVGHQRAEFRFDLRLRALTGLPRRRLPEALPNPTLPAGCHLQLDSVVTEMVLANVRRALRLPWKDLVTELRSMPEISLAGFLEETGLELEDLYRSAKGGWAELRRRAENRPVVEDDADRKLGRAIGRLLHVDDPVRLALLRDDSTDDQRLLAMLHVALLGGDVPFDSGKGVLNLLEIHPQRREELREVASILEERMHRVTMEVAGLPLRLHARYAKNEALAAFGVDRPGNVREGVKWVPEAEADVFFVTLRKSKGFSPTTMYNDRAISPTLFHWESQSTTRASSPTGQRYVNGGSTVHLFLRESKDEDGSLGAPPFFYAGPMTYVSSEGDRPMQVLWQLAHPLPADVFHQASLATP
ncbi:MULTISPECIES: DEAD/DEAH box helicase [Streptosporangium]|uniref:Superfamily II DNA or RNA helicase n=1 Tax=Streptosporangium brasiliense TaxID=47480 RepID=A0ABT9R8P7_9ACTN|nr:DEAD/DEAH box helicase [Streptosporangium brasiliense]MDP9864800.1 superfamily II DNA or RNA helicase [Streptosporangium brasiliense]